MQELNPNRKRLNNNRTELQTGGEKQKV